MKEGRVRNSRTHSGDARLLDCTTPSNMAPRQDCNWTDTHSHFRKTQHMNVCMRQYISRVLR